MSPSTRYPALHLSPDGVQLGSLVSGSTAPDVEEFSCDIPNGGKLHIIFINVHLKSKQLLRCQGSIKCQQTLDNPHTELSVKRAEEEGVCQVFNGIGWTQPAYVGCCWGYPVESLSGR